MLSNAAKTVLLIEDDAEIAGLLESSMREQGFKVSTIRNGEDAVTSALKVKPDVVLLDMGLPGISGIEVCKNLKNRAETREIPLIFLTGKQTEADIVLGLEMGAEDYITKPFHMRELIARVRTVLRRSHPAELADSVPVVSCGPIRLDAAKIEVTVDGACVIFTLTEFKLLRALISIPGRVFTRDQLLDKMSDGFATTSDRNIDVHIAAIRKKLKDHGAHIVSVRGVGYKALDEITAAA